MRCLRREMCVSLKCLGRRKDIQDTHHQNDGIVDIGLEQSPCPSSMLCGVGALRALAHGT